jgi:accessory gene regulator B
MDITKLSRSLAEHFGENLGYTEEKTDLLRFGFEIIIGEGLKLAVLIVIAATYDILPEMLSTIIRVCQDFCVNSIYPTVN